MSSMQKLGLEPAIARSSFCDRRYWGRASPRVSANSWPSGFDTHDRLRLRGSGLRLVAQQLEHFLHVGHIFVAQFSGFRVAVEVIVAVGKSQTRLVNFGNFLA